MSEYLTDEEQLARFRTWWERNGTTTVVAVVLAVGIVMGWRWYQRHVEERVDHASDLYAEFLEADAAARGELADRIIEEGQGTAYPAFVLLRQADTAVSDGDAAAAEPLLRRAVELASGDVLVELARLRLARVLFELDHADQALAELGRIRGEGYLSLAAELEGDIHLARGERDLAHQSYTTALSHVQSGDQRPVLEMKIADTADNADTAEAADAAETTEPSDTAGATGPSGPSESVEPAGEPVPDKPTDNADPAEPADEPETDKPADTTEPAEPADRSAP